MTKLEITFLIVGILGMNVFWFRKLRNCIKCCWRWHYELVKGFLRPWMNGKIISTLDIKISELEARVTELERERVENIGKQINDVRYKVHEISPGRRIMLFYPTTDDPSATPIEVCPNCRMENGDRPMLQWRNVLHYRTYVGVWVCPICDKKF